METKMESYPETDVDKREKVITRSFWQTLEPAMLYRVMSLPLYEAIIRLKVNDVGEELLNAFGK